MYLEQKTWYLVNFIPQFSESKTHTLSEFLSLQNSHLAFISTPFQKPCHHRRNPSNLTITKKPSHSPLTVAPLHPPPCRCAALTIVISALLIVLPLSIRSSNPHFCAIY
ncbi:hypothetical protein HN51_046855 [Arachis hypogaea]